MPQITKWFQYETFPYLTASEIWVSHDSVYEQCCFQGYDIVYSGKSVQTLQWNLLLTSSA